MTWMEFNNNDYVPICLPRTAEGATNRYLNQYERNFKGRYDDMRRLRALAEGKIIRLRRKAPTFHEEKLPLLINQACSALLTCDTSRESGIAKFNETHMYFLKILDDLTKTQPADEVSFQKELDRTKERDKLEKERKKLRHLITQLEAKEFDTDDLGDEDELEGEYAKTFELLDQYKARMKIVVHRLAQMEGEDIEDMDPFVLIVPKRSILNKLTEPQLKLLEDQFIEFVKKFKKSRELFMDQSHIEQIIGKLQLNPFKFSKDDLREINKAAMDAYRSHFRLQENRKRDEYFQELLDNVYLRPKEGEILESPDDVPEEVLERLEQSERQYKRKMEDMEEEFIKRQGNEEATQTDDEIEQDDESERIDEQLRKELERDSMMYKRIKEEPRDDDCAYNCDPELDDEVLENSPPMIGVVTPSDKIPVIDISDDDDL